MRRSGLRAALLALVAGPLAVGLAAAPASAAGEGLVITEAYLNGGSAGSSYTNKYVEIFNPTAAPIALGGLSLQYRPAAGLAQATGVAALSNVALAPGDYWVVSGGSNGTTTTPVPGVDQSATAINPGGTGGQLALVEGTAAISFGSGATLDAKVRDLVGYGTATTFETAPAPSASTTTSLQRAADGADTGDNAADFTALATSPGAPAPGDVDPGEPGDPVEVTIAQLQGTGAATPYAGQTVRTRGVVTAAYPTGGFNGFYLQTPGADTTPDASDGVFVYQPSFPAGITVGDSVEVVGTAKEFGTAPNTLTEIEVGATGSTTELTASLGAVVAKTTVPGTDCALPGTACLEGAALDQARERTEGELFAPAGRYTVTDAYDGSAFNSSSSAFGEIGLAAGSAIPLIVPTEVIDAQASAEIAARKAYNAAHRIILDDGSSTTFWNTTNTGQMGLPLPWETRDNYVRVGAGASFVKPVVLDYRFGWKLQPTAPVVGSGTGHVAFEQDRTAAPAPVGGDLKIATFNVLNYFTTLGKNVPGCSSFNDRDNNPIAVNRCPGTTGPRGAWDEVSFERQQTKIVNAIGRLDADVVSLEELENSVKVDGGDRDEAIAHLVGALNASAGTTRWAYAPSPAAADLPPVEAQDVIRTGFIYDPSTVEPVGASKVLLGSADFANARQPLAQAFRPKGASGTADAFAVVVNHLKSKGCSGAAGDNLDTGQGCWNGDRTRQAQALADFSKAFATERGVAAVFLAGDFNSYSLEDPIQRLGDNGFAPLSSDTADEWSYSFNGESGSLDHVLANAAAKALVTGVDIWEANANESVFRQYSRFNYNITQLYEPDQFSASDHNPEVIGIRTTTTTPPVVPVAVSVAATVTPAKVRVKADTASLDVTVTPAAKATGKVEAYVGGVLVGSGQAVAGRATITLAPFDKVGTKHVEVRYLGDAATRPGATTTRLRVVKQRPVLKVKHRRSVRATGKVTSPGKARIKVRAEGYVPTGKVKVTIKLTKGKLVIQRKLVNGRAKVRLPRLARGRYAVVVKYLGDDLTKKAVDRSRLRIG